MTRPIILDTDIGSDVDDALALALALASPELDLLAVTTVSRDVRRRAAIARTLLDLGGRPEVPVHAGCADALGRGPGFVWFGIEGEGIVGDGDDPRVDPEPAVDALARLLRARPGTEIVAVGPLTNVATLVRRAPDVVSAIGRLTVMGGHVRRVAIGDVALPHGVDYNLCSDPEASLTVLRAGIPTRLVTADVTLATWITVGDLVRIEAAGTPLHAALGRAVRLWMPVMHGLFGGLGAPPAPATAAFLHDPLALACALDESFCTFEDLAIEPALVDGVFRTIERPRATSDTARLRCATGVDADRFRRFLVERLVALRPRLAIC